MLKQKSGVTLIALIITIIVLLILAGVVINMTVGNEGIIGKAQSAVDMYKNAQEKEEYELAKVETEIDNYSRGTVTLTDEEYNAILSRISALETTGSSNPTGTIIAYSVNNVPSGYLKCEGQEVSRTTYANLFSIIGTNYGSGDGSTTFNVPDLRGEFLRGTGTNSHTNQGNGSAVGSHQDGTVHYLAGQDSPGSITVSNYGELWDSDEINYDATLNNSKSGRYQASWSSTFSDNRTKPFTSRPTNTSVLYCIKY